MSTGTASLGIIAVCGLAFLAGRATTHHQVHASSSPIAAQPGDEPPPLPAEFAEMLEAHEPGPNHDLLARLVGSWETEMIGMMPDGSQMRSRGFMQAEPIFEGRFIGQHFTGDVMGMPFEGLGVYGFSTATDEFQYVWFDSMSTHLYLATGHAAPDGRSITYRGEQPDPQGEGMTPFRDVITLISPDKHTFERYVIGPDGEAKAFEIVMTRE